MAIRSAVAGVVLICLALSTQSWAQSTNVFDYAKGIYEKNVKKLEDECEAKIKGLPAQYEKSLDELIAALQKKGDLDNLLAANKEKARYKTDRTVPETSPTELPDVIKTIQDAFRNGKTIAEKDKAQRLSTLTKQYIARLEQLKKDLTTQGRLEQALAVREEIQKLEITDALTSAASPTPDPAKLEPDKSKADPAVLDRLKNGLVLHYSFDKDQNGKVVDESGSGNDSNLHGTKWVPDGAIGGARHFNGISDYVDLGTEVCNGIRAISLWFNPEADIGLPSMKDYIALIHRDGDDGSGGNSVGLFFEGGGETPGYMIFCRNIGATHGSVFSDTRKWTAGQWCHVVGTIDPVSGMALYVNGAKQLSTHPSTRASSPSPSTRSAQPESIGRWGKASVRYFSGKIDDVRIYSRSLGPEDVQSLFALRNPGVNPGVAGTPSQPRTQPPAKLSTPPPAINKAPRIALPGGAGLKQEPAKLYQRAVSSVVVVVGPRGHGSGFSVGRKDIILTNAHVVQNATSVKVYPFAYENEKLKRLNAEEGEVVYRSDEADIAVVKLASPGSQLTPLPVARKNPAPGAKVYAMGSPGIGDAVLEQTLSDGIVSSGGREFGGHVFVQHTAAVNPGNSGGPLLSEQGEVVGMNTVKAFLEGVSFAIPAEKIREVFEGK